jgi:nitrite reductase/ring-hydroxylating ferredoxin subunit
MLSLVALASTTPLAFVANSAVGPAVGQRAAVSMADKQVKTIADKQVWVTFANAADCQPGTIISGFQYGQELAIACEPKGGKLYAMSNKMPPTSQPATFGELEGNGIIREPVSQTKFDMKTGKPVGPWCPGPVGKIIGFLVGPTNMFVYPVRKSGNKVQALINVNAKAQFEASYWRGVLDAQGKVDGGYY